MNFNVTTLDLVFVGIAVWRLSTMLNSEYGPFGLFYQIRKICGIRHSLDGQPMSFSHKNVLNCIWCLSVWIGGIILACWLKWPYQTSIVIYILDLSTIAITVDSVIELIQKILTRG